MSAAIARPSLRRHRFPVTAVGRHDEARYGLGRALQQQRNLDGAVTAYGQVVARTATDLAAKAQLQIGLCRMEQKRYLDAANAFLVIPTTYDYPELRAAALFEAGKAYLELKQALGRSFANERRVLELLDAFMARTSAADRANKFRIELAP